MCSESSAGKLWDFFQVFFQIAIQLPNIASVLHAKPNLGAVAKHLTQAHRDRRRHTLLFRQDVVEGLSRNSEEARDFDLGLTSRRKNDLAQQFARVGGF
jgi:hypothetical protein